MADIPAGLLANLKTSLETPAAGWSVLSFVEPPPRSEVQSVPGDPPTTENVATRDIICGLVSAELKQPGTIAPLHLTYMARVDDEDWLIVATVHMANGSWQTTDTELHALIVAKGAAFLAALGADLQTVLAA